MSSAQKINVRVPRSAIRYPLVVQCGSLKTAGAQIESLLPLSVRRVVIVSNPTVYRLYGDKLTASLRRTRFSVSHWLMGDGERFKSWRSLEHATLAFAKAGLERSDAVIALGGGVVGDLAGFAAATYLRGISLVQIPTTLLAQIDSSVGGKTGINAPRRKNGIGAFHHPSAVLIDPETLQTLPARELTAGWCEAIKQSAIANRRLFDDLADLLQPGPKLAVSGAAIEKVIARLCAVKARIVSGDPLEDPHRTDARSRRILNFGHTVGHALESATKYRRFRHGEAVGWGMLVAGEIAKKLEILPVSELELLKSVINLAGHLPQTRDLDPADIMELMKHDKKRFGGSVKWVLLERIGAAKIVDGTEIPASLIRTAVHSVLAR